jgi:imidazolonepropionase
VLIRRIRQLLTLYGPSGPRRGSHLAELSVIEDAAVLIHNGVIREAGPARRVENLSEARSAREIDAANGVVMPAFTDPDAALIFPRNSRRGSGAATGFRTWSKARLESLAVASSAAFARHGVLSVGAHTGHAADSPDALKVLRAHQSVQPRPLRVRSVFAWQSTGNWSEEEARRVLTNIRQRRLAAILEFWLADGTRSTDEKLREMVRRAAGFGATLGYSFRLKSLECFSHADIGLALDAGALALVGPAIAVSSAASELGGRGCVHVIPVPIESGVASVAREEVQAGIPVAIASGFNAVSRHSFNPQYLLQAAIETLGLSLEECISMATYNAACSLRMSHVTGSVEPGKSADLLVVDIPDYRDLALRAGHCDVRIVIRAGFPIYRQGALLLD